MVPSKINDVFFIRFAVCAVSTEKEHIDFAWNEIVNLANATLKNNQLSYV